MDLLNMLTFQLGIKEEQAVGGAGLLFKLAKVKLGGDFSLVSNAIPDVTNLISKAPEESSGLGGGLIGAIGGIA